MFHERFKQFRRRGDGIGAGQGGVSDMADMAYGSRQNLGFQIRIIVVYGANVLNQLHAVGAGVVNAPDEGRDEARTGLCRNQRLIRGKAQGDIDIDSLFHQGAACAHPLPGGRQFDDDILGDGGEGVPLGNHAARIRRHHFGAHRSGGQRADVA